MAVSLTWRRVILAWLALLLASCAAQSVDAPAKQLASTERATIYSGGPILTMAGDQPEYAEALVVVGGDIAFVGSHKEALARYPVNRQEDLAGQTMLPGFLDGHGHLYNAGFLSLMANLFPPPDGPGQSHASIVASLKAWSQSDEGKLVVSKYGWIIGSGYDDSQLAEKDHPTADVLDQVSTEWPVLIIHQSGHLAAINNKAIELLGFDSETPDPKGGVFRRKADGSPDGVLEEAAFMTVAFNVISKTDEEMHLASLAKGQEEYARWGYTTAQDGRSSPVQVGAFSRAAEAGKLFIDLVAYPDIQFGISEMQSDFYRAEPVYRGGFRIGGAKLSLDGSPQGKTAWLTTPYFHPPHGQGPDYNGYPALPDAEANALVEKAFSNGWQLLVHANGDAAIDQMIAAVEQARAQHPKPGHRTVLIHGQTLRKDQIAKLVSNGILPSLFPMHTYYWGDWHRDSVLGPKRASYISPMRDVLAAGLTATSHHDAPVTFPNSMRVLDATVNRTTRSGKVLGPGQRLTPYEGLKTLTHWAAIQYFEEERKGTLEAGKMADLVILDHNPLTIDPGQIDTIRVTRTIKAGKSVWPLR